jgi:fluoride ion exporter CrcB/FEX
MPKEKLNELSLEKLKKKLLYANILASIIGIAAISAIVFYFIERENNYELLIVGIGLGAGLSTYTGSTINKIKKELKSRTDN